VNLTWRDWLQRRVELRALRNGRTGLEYFVTTLLDEPDEEVALLVAMAAAVRLRLREAGHLPDDVLHIDPHREYEQATVQLRIARLVRSHQRRSEYLEAAAAMVWVHTLRALAKPELHELAVGMWQQLERGIPQAAAALGRIETATHQLLPAGTLQACEYIPVDFWQPMYGQTSH
jgi:hypothetical protein